MRNTQAAPSISGTSQVGLRVSKDPSLGLSQLATKTKGQDPLKSVAGQWIDPYGIAPRVDCRLKVNNKLRHLRATAHHLEYRVLDALSVPFTEFGDATQASLTVATESLHVVHHEGIHRTTLTCAS